MALRHKLQIVPGRMVLRVGAPRGPHQAAYRKVKTGGTVLSLVVPIRAEVFCLRISSLVIANRQLRGSVYLAVTPPGSLPRKSPWTSNPRQHHAMTNAREHRFAPGEPGDRTNRRGHEEESVGVTAGLDRHPLRQRGRYDDAAQIVVTQGGVADVRRHEDLVDRVSFDDVLPPREGADLERAVDVDRVGPVLGHSLEVVMSQTEAPGSIPI